MVIPQKVIILYIIEVASFSTAFDADAEHTFDVFLMTVEGGTWYRDSSAHIRFDPTFVQLLKAEASSAIKGLGYPNILLEDISYFHRIRRFNWIQIKAFYLISSKIMQFFFNLFQIMVQVALNFAPRKRN